MSEKFILALDQGTTSSRAIVFNRRGEPVGTAQKEFAQHFPQPGWIEHDPLEIWETQREVMHGAVREAGIDPRRIAAIGITNQRETTVVWDRKSSRPVYNAIVWQCRRTAPFCEELKQSPAAGRIHEKTGLVVDAYFSGTKVKWILDNVPGAREKAGRGELAFGTVDSWLLWNLTGGAVHCTDYTNAARTMLFDIRALRWDAELLDEMTVPASMLPGVKPSRCRFGKTAPAVFDGAAVPVAGIAGDQQAALFGQGLLSQGQVKNTYGTGCFVIMNTGDTPVYSDRGLVTTIAWGTKREVVYALEGSIFIGGAVIQWIRDGLGLIDNAAQSEAIAQGLADSDGVYVVPAFTGLGAPHWDMYARGAILGLTRGSNRSHIVRAALESIAYQSKDIIDIMEQDSRIKIPRLNVDGGAAANGFLMQFQADILDRPVVRPKHVESTAFGAACLAGLESGFWKTPADIGRPGGEGSRFLPSMPAEKRERLYAGWRKAVSRAGEWEER